MLDAFSMWSIDQAKEYIDKTLHAPIYFLEEIVKKDNEYGNYIKLKQYTNTKIAGGESTVNIFQAKQLLDTQSIDILQTDILGGGGFTGLKSISELAKSYGVTIEEFFSNTITSILYSFAHLVTAIPLIPIPIIHNVCFLTI